MGGTTPSSLTNEPLLSSSPVSGRVAATAFCAAACHQGGGHGPAHAARRLRQGRGRRQGGGALRRSTEEAKDEVTVTELLSTQ